MAQNLLDSFQKICEEFILDPQENLKKIERFVKEKEIYADYIFLFSLVKTFIDTAPLYRVKIIANMLQQKNQISKIKQFDIDYSKVYGHFIANITARKSLYTFKAAIKLYDSLFYYNYSEKLLSFLIEGSNYSEVEGEIIDLFMRLLENDNEFQELPKIFQQMLNFKFSKNLLMIFKNENIFNRLVFYKEKLNKHFWKKKEKSGEKKYFKKYEKKERKILRGDKKNLERENRKEANDEYVELNKRYQMFLNAFHRIILYILRDKKSKFYTVAFQLLVQYKDFIYDRFKEGIFQLLNEIARSDDKKTTIGVYRTIFYLKNKCFDGGVEIEKIVDLLPSIFFEESEGSIREILLDLLSNNFLKLNMTYRPELIIKFLKKLILFASLSQFNDLKKYVKRLCDFYEIDITDRQKINFYEVSLFYKIK